LQIVILSHSEHSVTSGRHSQTIWAISHQKNLLSVHKLRPKMQSEVQPD